MKKALLFIFIFSVSFLPASSSYGADAFLRRGAGARAIAMGGALTAVANDSAAAYWNPAGLAGIDEYRVSFMFQQLDSARWPGMEDISPEYHFVSVILPFEKLTGNGVAAVSLVRHGIDNIPHTRYDGAGGIVRDSFSSSDSAIIVSYGYPFFEGLFRAGGSFKYISRDFSSIKDGSARGWDIDAGFIITLSPELDIGVMMSRGAEVTWDTGHTDKGSLRTRLGLAYTRYIVDNISVLATMDLCQEKDHPLAGSAGTEILFLPEVEGISSFAVRAGMDSLYLENRYGNTARLNEDIGWNVGGGIGSRLFNLGLNLDYAFAFRRLGSGHIFNVTLGGKFN